MTKKEVLELSEEITFLHKKIYQLSIDLNIMIELNHKLRADKTKVAVVMRVGETTTLELCTILSITSTSAGIKILIK